MTLVRVDEDSLVEATATIQRRGFCHFADTTERSQQLPNPELGCVSVIGTSFDYWNGTAWTKFPPP